MVVAILLVCGAVAAVVGSRGEAKSFSGATSQVALEKRAIVKVRADNFPACFLFSNTGCKNGFTTLNAQPVCVTLTCGPSRNAIGLVGCSTPIV